MPFALRCLVLAGVLSSFGASFTSPNFIVHAPTAEMAEKIASTAEAERARLGELWFGHSLPEWKEPCVVSAKVNPQLGAGGKTTFRFSRGEVYGWKMEVQGSFERILDSVIPHEVNHTILACYFRRALPRWADEGMASQMEHESERRRQTDLVQRLVHSGQRIPLRTLLSIREYPADYDQMMALYAEGFALTDFLIQQAGRQRFLVFLNDAHHRGWDEAIKTCYGRRNVEQLEQSWSNWVLAGCPRLKLPTGQMLASTGTPASSSGGSVRSQSPASRAAPSAGSLAAVSLANVTSSTGATLDQGRASVADVLPTQLSAPDPRNNSTLTASNPIVTTRNADASMRRSVSASTGLDSVVRLTNAPGVRQAAAVSSQASDADELQLEALELRPVNLEPLELKPVRVDVEASDSAALPLQSGRIDRSLNGLQEAALRTEAEPVRASRSATDSRFLNWSQFPSRVR